MKNEKEFNEQLLCAIEDGLKQIFTEAALKTIYSYLHKKYSLKREDIPEKLDIFMQGLENFFKSGSVVIKLVILKNLYSTLGFDVEQIPYNQDFIDSIERLKSHILHQAEEVTV